MKALNPNAIAFLTTLSVLSPMAHSAELAVSPLLIASPDAGVQPINTPSQRDDPAGKLAPVVQRGVQVVLLDDTAKSLLEATRIRSNVLSMTIPRAGLLVGNDRTSFSVYAPMQTMNDALSLAGYISRSEVNPSVVTLAQMLSLAAKRQVNTELKYAVKVDSRSNFESALIYRLDRSADSDRSGVILRVRYSVKF